MMAALIIYWTALILSLYKPLVHGRELSRNAISSFHCQSAFYRDTAEVIFNWSFEAKLAATFSDKDFHCTLCVMKCLIFLFLYKCICMTLFQVTG